MKVPTKELLKNIISQIIAVEETDPQRRKLSQLAGTAKSSIRKWMVRFRENDYNKTQTKKPRSRLVIQRRLQIELGTLRCVV